MEETDTEEVLNILSMAQNMIKTYLLKIKKNMKIDGKKEDEK